jgi:hypothetical protein
VNSVQHSHVNDQPASVLRRISVGSAKAPRDHPARAGLPHGLGDDVDVPRGKHFGAQLI